MSDREEETVPPTISDHEQEEEPTSRTSSKSSKRSKKDRKKSKKDRKKKKKSSTSEHEAEETPVKKSKKSKKDKKKSKKVTPPPPTEDKESDHEAEQSASEHSDAEDQGTDTGSNDGTSTETSQIGAPAKQKKKKPTKAQKVEAWTANPTTPFHEQLVRAKHPSGMNGAYPVPSTLRDYLNSEELHDIVVTIMTDSQKPRKNKDGVEVKSNTPVYDAEAEEPVICGRHLAAVCFQYMAEQSGEDTLKTISLMDDDIPGLIFDDFLKAIDAGEVGEQFMPTKTAYTKNGSRDDVKRSSLISIATRYLKWEKVRSE
jgi:hypothetical protein